MHVLSSSHKLKSARMPSLKPTHLFEEEKSSKTRNQRQLFVLAYSAIVMPMELIQISTILTRMLYIETFAIGMYFFQIRVPLTYANSLSMQVWDSFHVWKLLHLP